MKTRFKEEFEHLVDLKEERKRIIQELDKLHRQLDKNTYAINLQEQIVGKSLETTDAKYKNKFGAVLEVMGGDEEYIAFKIKSPRGKEEHCKCMTRSEFKIMMELCGYKEV